ncbi:hypothetical protein ERUR111494_07835 [Erysipelothrix urinaevulpis]|uniref:hypothetical protein n=1 Tax=Erysipelothrix urinaevulpis TaxID=2683717 RepID=UPI00135ABBC0|nr:hypothetical protein [Erysipelothrix urinaevulpis]
MNKFIRELQQKIGYLNKEGRAYIKDFKNTIILAHGNDATYQDLVEQYGTTDEIANGYLAAGGFKDVPKGHKFKLYILTFIVFALFVGLYIVLRNHFESERAFIDREVIIVEGE